jgi:hypothetical protein
MAGIWGGGEVGHECKENYKTNLHMKQEGKKVHG